MRFHEKVHLVETRKQLLSAKYHGRAHGYIVGFQNIGLANRVRRFVNHEKHANIEKGIAYDIAHDVKTALLELSMPIFGVSDIINIEVEAILKIPKISPAAERYTAPVIKPEDFLMIPFTKNVGIVYPLELIDDDLKQWTFSCNIVHPSPSFTKIDKTSE